MAFSLLEPNISDMFNKKRQVAGGAPVAPKPQGAFPFPNGAVMQENPVSLKGYDTPRPAGYQAKQTNFSRVGNGSVGNPMLRKPDVNPATVSNGNILTDNLLTMVAGGAGAPKSFSPGATSAFMGQGNMLPAATRISGAASGVAARGPVAVAPTTSPMLAKPAPSAPPPVAAPVPAPAAPAAPSAAGQNYLVPPAPAAAVGPGNVGLEAGQRLRPGIGEQAGVDQPPELQGAWATNPQGIITKSVMLGDATNNQLPSRQPAASPLVPRYDFGGAREQSLTNAGQIAAAKTTLNRSRDTGAKRDAQNFLLRNVDQPQARQDAEAAGQRAERMNAVTATMGAVGADAKARGEIGVAKVKADAERAGVDKKEAADRAAAEEKLIADATMQFAKDGVVTETVPGFIWDSEKKRIPGPEDIAKYEAALRKARSGTGGGGSGQVAQPKTRAEVEALPRGTSFMWNGQLHTRS